MPCKRRGVFFLYHYCIIVEACVAWWLTPQTVDLEVWGSSLACCVVSLDKELYSTLSLFTHVYTAILRKVVGNSAHDNPERYCGWF